MVGLRLNSTPMKRIYIVFALILTLLCVSSCKTITKVEYRDRYIDNYITQVVHDTLREYVSDSTSMEIREINDTIYITKYKERTKWRDKIVVHSDTCWRDSIVTQYIENTKNVKYIPKFFWICFVFSSIIITFALVKLAIWLKTRFWA